MEASSGCSHRNESTKYNDFCDPGLLLPFIPYEATWSTPVRATLYFCGLIYCFMGVAIVADIFMGSIEKITSKTKKIYLSTTGKDSEPEVVEVKLWNDTIANLTLMALGSSAPEICISCIEIFGNNFEAGELGPGVIIGTAAFNLLVICAVCIMIIPNGETKSIKLFNVFLLTSAFSMLSYLWLLVILKVSTENTVDIWEAMVTFLFFPLFVLLAWWADRGWVCGNETTPTLNQLQIELGMESSDGRDSISKTQKKLFMQDGEVSEVDKEDLIDMYKEVRKYPDMSDSDAAILAATKLIDSQPRSRLWYRIAAIREISGSRRMYPVLSEKLRTVYETINAHPLTPDIRPVSPFNDLQNKKAIIEFHASCYTVPENIGKFNVTVIRHGRMDNTVRVRLESFDGTAKVGSEYVPVNEVLVFGPDVMELNVAIGIVDDNKWELGEVFFLRLTIIAEEGAKDRRDAILGQLPIMEIVILNDDEPGKLSFRKRGLLVKESCQVACIAVERTNGTDGDVSVQWKTIDGSAKSPQCYEGGQGILVFKHGEALRIIEIPIVDYMKPKRDECFEIKLMNPDGGAQLGGITKLAVTIINDDDINSVLQRMMVMTSLNIKSMQVHPETWKTQIQSALTVNGGDTESATNFDYVMHFLTFGWKVLFALIPPPGYFGGWLCFFCSLVAIGLLTAVVSDLASIFGCLIHLRDRVTAITIVTLGTSLPDLFASKSAATSEKYADNAVGNVTGSNSVNVFLGLGFPWMISAIYHAAHGTEFKVPSEDIVFLVGLYSAVAFVGLALIIVRRFLPVFGKAELGGPPIPKYISGVFMIILWVFYVALASLQAYGHI